MFIQVEERIISYNSETEIEHFLARRNLLALEETSNAQIGEDISAVEAVSSAPVPEVFR